MLKKPNDLRVNSKWLLTAVCRQKTWSGFFISPVMQSESIWVTGRGHSGWGSVFSTITCPL
jgi:hypothetical protein